MIDIYAQDGFREATLTEQVPKYGGQDPLGTLLGLFRHPPEVKRPVNGR